MKLTHNMDQTIKKVSKLGKEIESDVAIGVGAVAKDAVIDAKRKAPINDGGLRQSIHDVKVSDLSYDVIVGERYGAYVEFGTGAHVRVPSELKDVAKRIQSINTKGTFREGLENIRDWLKSNGGDPDDAYIVFMSILKRGLRPRPFLYPALLEARRNLKKELLRIVKRKTK